MSVPGPTIHVWLIFQLFRRRFEAPLIFCIEFSDVFVRVLLGLDTNLWISADAFVIRGKVWSGKHSGQKTYGSAG